MPGPDTTGYRRILAVKLADLGDLLTITPALQALRAAHPRAQIDLLVPPSSAGLLANAPYLDNVITFNKFAFDNLKGLLNAPNTARTAAFLLRLRLARYDALAIFHHFTGHWGTLKFAALSFASGARARAGIDNGRGRMLTLTVEDRGFGAMHETDYWLRVASLLGADPTAGWQTHITIDDSTRSVVSELMTNLGMNHASPLIAMHPGAGAYSRARMWPAEMFAEVARGLLADENAGIVVTGGPDEEETAAALESAVGSARVVSLAGRTTIHQTAELIRRCSLFVGNDSGPMHLAAAVGTPVVAVFGPSNRQAWEPYSPPGTPSPHRVVMRDLPCMPCFYRVHSLGLREGCGPRPCLTGLPSGPVLETCRQALSISRRASGEG